MNKEENDDGIINACNDIGNAISIEYWILFV